MYNTKTAISISLKDLLDKIDDYTIYSYYLGPIKIGKLINSPLRSDDKNPSFAIFYSKNNALLFKDHGTGQSGNSLTFIKLYKNIKNRTELEKELLRIVRKTNPNNNICKNTYNYTNKSEIDIGIVRQPFTKIDKEYWNSFNINISTLIKFNVFSIKYFLCNRVVRGTYKESSPMYAYKVYGKFKIYRPLASKYTKWRSNLTNRHVQGLAELPVEGGNILIITKSLKDVMCLYEMGFYAISASSETTFIPEDILNDLSKKWKYIFILYDRDETGMKRARNLSKTYNLPAFFVHKKFKAKDISDAIRNSSFENVKEFLTKIFIKYD